MRVLGRGNDVALALESILLAKDAEERQRARSMSQAAAQVHETRTL